MNRMRAVVAALGSAALLLTGGPAAEEAEVEERRSVGQQGGSSERVAEGVGQRRREAAAVRANGQTAAPEAAAAVSVPADRTSTPQDPDAWWQAAWHEDAPVSEVEVPFDFTPGAGNHQDTSALNAEPGPQAADTEHGPRANDAEPNPQLPDDWWEVGWWEDSPAPEFGQPL